MTRVEEVSDEESRGEEIFDAGARGEKDRGEDTVAKANSVIIREIIEEMSS